MWNQCLLIFRHLLLLAIREEAEEEVVGVVVEMEAEQEVGEDLEAGKVELLQLSVLWMLVS